MGKEGERVLDMAKGRRKKRGRKKGHFSIGYCLLI